MNAPPIQQTAAGKSERVLSKSLIIKTTATACRGTKFGPLRCPPQSRSSPTQSTKIGGRDGNH